MSANYVIDLAISDQNFGIQDIMYKDYERCTFTNCDFTQCDFLGTAFTDCVFVSCNFNEAKINYVSLRDAQFTNCNFTGVNFSMVDSLLFSVTFTNCVLDYSRFYTLKIKGTLFSNCSITAADFMQTDMTDVVFDNCNLHKSVFSGTIANKADFSTSYNFVIDPEKNKLKKAKFSAAGLKGLLEKYDIVVK
jgi:uncharacterized protein YjbI with pentapeptide repeats